LTFYSKDAFAINIKHEFSCDTLLAKISTHLSSVYMSLCYALLLYFELFTIILYILYIQQAPSNINCENITEYKIRYPDVTSEETVTTDTSYKVYVDGGVEFTLSVRAVNNMGLHSLYLDITETSPEIGKELNWENTSHFQHRFKFTQTIVLLYLLALIGFLISSAMLYFQHQSGDQLL